MPDASAIWPKVWSCFVEPTTVEGRQAMGVIFDADAFSEQVELVQQIAQVDRRVGAVAVGPQHNVLDDRGLTRLAQVGRAGEQHHRAVGLHHKRLEEAEAEGVVAGQPVHALLGEKQHGVELFLGHLDQEPVAAGIEFGKFKVQSHQICSNTIAETWRP